MPGVEVDASIGIKRLDRIIKQAENLPFQKAGEIIRDSIHRNFDEGGRPGKWPARKVDKPWPILKKTETLKNAHYIELIRFGVAVGNREPYQAAHNFGFPQRGLDQRKFQIIQPQDIRKINRIFIKHIIKS